MVHLSLLVIWYFSVEGGELFERIVDENYQLTELDAIVFTKQICEGVQYLHQQYILHLDLKVNPMYCTECYNMILTGYAVYSVACHYGKTGQCTVCQN